MITYKRGFVVSGMGATSAMTVKPGFVATKMTEDMDLPERLTAQPGEVAVDIYKAQQKNKNVLYTKWIWRWVMLVIRMILEWKFKGMSI